MKELEHKDYGLVRVAAVTPRLYLADVDILSRLTTM